MPLLLPVPVVQFCDANGAPYAGGTIDTYIPGTDTLKQTWQDHLGSVLNTNPIVLDSAGRALIYGDGEYRFVLKDAAGNLIYDQLTDSVVSDAMLPVVQASSLSSARDMLGVTAAIQTETDRAVAAESALSGVTTTVNTNLTALQLQLSTQLGGGMIQGGIGTTNSYGYGTAVFAKPYSGSPVVICTPYYGSAISISMVAESTSTNFNAWAADATGAGIAIGFNWIAFGPL